MQKPEIRIEVPITVKDPCYIGPLHSRREVLMSGTTSDGFKFWIVDYGSHPCAYIEVPQTLVERYASDDSYFEDAIDVHGGVTWHGKYTGDDSLYKDFTGMLIGWDYAHAGDCLVNGPLSLEGKRYTTSDILLDTMSVSEQLVRLVQREEKHTA